MTDAETAKGATQEQSGWKRMHAEWVRGEVSTDDLLAASLMLGPGHPSAWAWAMTVVGMQAKNPRSVVVICDV